MAARLAGYAVAAVLAPVLAVVLAILRGQLDLTAVAVFVAVAVAVAVGRLADHAVRHARQAAAAIAESEAARPIAAADRMRTALLAAVSHDLRTPLAAAKERVIANLTANALRYSPSGSPPLLTASARGRRVVLRVIDHGPGVPEADRDRIFAAFQRLGDTGSTIGVGLGLTVSRGLTEAMGGTLEPEETPGGGLTVAISVPAAPGPARPHSDSPTRREREGIGPAGRHSGLLAI